MRAALLNASLRPFCGLPLAGAACARRGSLGLFQKRIYKGVFYFFIAANHRTFYFLVAANYRIFYLLVGGCYLLCHAACLQRAIFIQEGCHKPVFHLLVSIQNLFAKFSGFHLIFAHGQNSFLIGAYRAMEEAYREGKLKAIGVCNFYPNRLADLCETVEVTPAVNQVELHPFFQQENALTLMKEYGVVPEAWGPFAEGNHGIFTHPVLTEIGKQYGKTAAQVALRWNVQRGVVVIPKSVHKNRMEQNIDIWDFQLSEEDMAQIAKLDLGHSEIVDHSDPGFVKMLHSMKVHD